MKFSATFVDESLKEILAEFLQSFTRHPEQNGKTYLQHLVHAWSLSFQMARGSIALLIHGMVPKWFEHTGSSIISSLSRTLSKQQ
jgi:hypothetical protein